MTTQQAAERATGMGTIERTADGATVRFERHFPSPPADVWRALTDPSELAQWLSDADVELRIGGAIQVRFDDGTMNGVITDIAIESVLAYSWHEADRNESHVRWELEPTEEGTTLHLTHMKLAPESASGFGGGWHHHLDRLEAVVAGNPLEWSWKTFEELEPLYRS
jgi:uncharacterized protein YndB with AHSA1/START domain